MKLKIASLEVEADTLDDIRALIALALETLPTIPAGPSKPALAIPGASNGDRERGLRDTYKEKYGKVFSMKGKTGSPLAYLESLECAGWPADGSAESDGLDGPPATQQDDGEPVF